MGLQEFEQLREMNLAKGGSLDNAIVVDEYRILNPDGLRHEDEFVRHKILDAIGDLYLLGYSLIGEFVGFKSGHTENHLLRKALLENTSAWELVTFGDETTVPPAYCGAAQFRDRELANGFFPSRRERLKRSFQPWI